MLNKLPRLFRQSRRNSRKEDLLAFKKVTGHFLTEIRGHNTEERLHHAPAAATSRQIATGSDGFLKRVYARAALTALQQDSGVAKEFLRNGA
jgi:hypothetical protein